MMSYFCNTALKGFWQSNQAPALALTISSILVASPLPSFAQGAGAVSPGAVKPQLERRSLPTEQKTPSVSIPALPDRPLGIDEGPTVVVKHFKLQGVDDLPQRGLSQLLQQQLVDHKQGFTIGQLQQTANLVTQLYRQQGFILAQAYIPQQDIKGDAVIIQVLSGKLGQLSSRSSKRYSDELLMSTFVSSKGKTVNALTTENALLSINDLPGLDVAGIFRPGKNIGETELVLNVNEEIPFEFSLAADNHGVETTGRQRIFGHAKWNNPTGHGDQIIVTALQTFDPSDSAYGAIGYEIPLATPHWIVGANLNTNDYVIAQSVSQQIPLKTDGESQTASIYSRYQFHRSREFNLSATVDFSRKWAEVEATDFKQKLGEDNLSVFSGVLNFDSINTQHRAINKGSVSYSHGLAGFAGSMASNASSLTDGNNSLGAAEADFQKLNLNLTRLQAITQGHNLLIRLQAQHSDDTLSSLERFSMGGPNSVRAYPVSEYIRDKGVFTSLAWVMSAPGFSSKPAFAGRNWGEVFRVSLFADYAAGKLNRTFNGSLDKKVEISGAGIGLELNLTDRFFIRAEAAKALSSREDSRGDDSQYWLSAGFNI